MGEQSFNGIVYKWKDIHDGIMNVVYLYKGFGNLELFWCS